MTLRLMATALAANLAATTAAIALDASLPAYQTVSGAAGDGERLARRYARRTRILPKRGR
jgi:hypothetical protein